MTPEKEKIWEEATLKGYAENPMGTNWDRISIAMDLYAESKVKNLSSNPLLTDVKQLKEFLLALRFAEDERIRNEAQKMLGLYFC